MSDVRRIDIKEFRDIGFLQEANRLFFHPRGLALEIVTNDETGEPERLGGIWDYRDDPEGILYGDDQMTAEKRDRVEEERLRHVEARQDLFHPGNDVDGHLDDAHIQPVDWTE